MVANKNEKVSFITHFLAIFIFIFLSVPLLKVSKSYYSKIIHSIYLISVIFLFSASSLYHRKKIEDDEISIWRKIDHIAIFVMIAGTYTPMCALYFNNTKGYIILLLQWILVLFGVILKLFFLNINRLVYTLIYLLMGWMAILLIYDIILTFDIKSIIYLFAGGISFTIGAIFYIIKWPKKDNLFGFHEIFHIFIVLGALFHYCMIYNLSLVK